MKSMLLTSASSHAGMNVAFDVVAETSRSRLVDFLGEARAALVAAVAAYRSNNRRRIALRSLLEMDAYRLDDLGITPQDVIEAMERRR